MNKGDAAHLNWGRGPAAYEFLAAKLKLALIGGSNRTVQELGKALVKHGAVVVADQFFPATDAHFLDVVQVGRGPCVHRVHNGALLAQLTNQGFNLGQIRRQARAAEVDGGSLTLGRKIELHVGKPLGNVGVGRQEPRGVKLLPQQHVAPDADTGHGQGHSDDRQLDRGPHQRATQARKKMLQQAAWRN